MGTTETADAPSGRPTEPYRPQKDLKWRNKCEKYPSRPGSKEPDRDDDKRNHDDPLRFVQSNFRLLFSLCINRDINIFHHLY